MKSKKQPLIIPKIIQEMVQRIVERFHPEKIVLFGSCARGEITYDSDVDLLVIMPVEGSRREKSLEIYKTVSDFPVPTDIIVRTPEEVDEFGEIIGTVLFPALKEGKILYEKSLEH